VTDRSLKARITTGYFKVRAADSGEENPNQGFVLALGFFDLFDREFFLFDSEGEHKAEEESELSSVFQKLFVRV
jgi:hypothetical protein